MKSIWVYYKSQYGIDPGRDQAIRESLGEDLYCGSGLHVDGERDHSFDWSEEIEKKAVDLINSRVISRIQIFDTQPATL